jgi:hypothetical protein
MPDPIVTALIAGVGAVGGGLMTALGKPWGENWVARQAEERATKRERANEYKVRLERVLQLLGMAAVEGPRPASVWRQEKELPASAYAVNDPELLEAVDRMSNSPHFSPAWNAAHKDASRRVGQLLSSR